MGRTGIHRRRHRHIILLSAHTSTYDTSINMSAHNSRRVLLCRCNCLSRVFLRFLRVGERFRPKMMLRRQRPRLDKTWATYQIMRSARTTLTSMLWSKSSISECLSDNKDKQSQRSR